MAPERLPGKTFERAMSRNYALAIHVGGDMNKSIVKSWRLLSRKYSIRYIYDRLPFPHITLAAGSFSGTLAHLMANTQEAVSLHKPFRIRGDGLGIFIRATPVIYVRWMLNRQLMSLFESFHNSFEKVWGESADTALREIWVPKTTIAFFDTSYEVLSPAINDIRSFNFERTTVVRKILVIEYSEHCEAIVGEIGL